MMSREPASVIIIQVRLQDVVKRDPACVFMVHVR